MNSNSDFVIVTSDEPWGEVWHTQLHYAWQLSLRFNVIYVSPPSSWKPKNLLPFFKSVSRITDSLHVLPYHNLLPAFLGLPAMLINDLINQYRINSIIKKKQSPRIVAVWQFDHFRGYYLFRTKKQVRHLYHLVDPAVTDKYDSKFAIGADQVVVTSPKFFDHYKTLNRKVLQIPQGVDLEFYRGSFQQSDTSVSDVASGTVLLLGTLTDDVDFILLYKIALKYPGKLLVIGPDKIASESSRNNWNKLLNSNLIRWLGPMSPPDFLPYLLRCRVGLIVYVEESLVSNNLRSPLKVINYIASGKCVISNIDCEIPSLINRAIYRSESEDSFFRLLELSFLNELKFDSDAVDSFLYSIDYNNHLSKIFTELGINLPDIK